MNTIFKRIFKNPLLWVPERCSHQAANRKEKKNVATDDGCIACATKRTSIIFESIQRNGVIVVKKCASFFETKKLFCDFLGKKRKFGLN